MIRLSEGETEMLTRALQEARDQADVGAPGETETQRLLRSVPGIKHKTGISQSTQNTSYQDGNTVF